MGEGAWAGDESGRCDGWCGSRSVAKGGGACWAEAVGSTIVARRRRSVGGVSTRRWLVRDDESNKPKLTPAGRSVGRAVLLARPSSAEGGCSDLASMYSGCCSALKNGATDGCVGVCVCVCV